MAKGGIFALMAGPKSKGSADSLPGESAGPGSSTLDAKAAALKSMWSNMKAGDFEAAGLDFQEAYDLCAEAHAEEDTDDDDPLYEGESEEL